MINTTSSAFTFGLQINWSKIKILQVPSSSSSSTVQVADGHVKVVDAFAYPGCMIYSGGSRGEVLRQTDTARILHGMDLDVKHQAENQVTPLSDIHCASLMYGCETWATTKYLHSGIDAFYIWALCMMLRIPYTRHVSNAEVRGTTGCSSLSHLVINRRLALFSHTAHSSLHEDHHRALAVAVRQVPPDWK